MKIEMKTGKVYLSSRNKRRLANSPFQTFIFTNFVLGYRNTCYTLILEQAKKIDCLLGKAYKDGQLKDVDDSDEDTKPKAAGIFSRKRGHSRSVSVSDTSSPMGSPATR